MTASALKASQPACMRDLFPRKNLAVHGPALLATCERLLSRDPSRDYHSGVWRRLGNIDNLLVALHDVRRRAIRSTGVEALTHFDARCTRLLGVNYDELIERTLPPSAFLALGFRHSTEPNRSSPLALN